MKTKFKQLSISDVFTDIESIFEENKPKFIKLFDSYINFSEIVPQSFYEHYTVIMVVIESSISSLCFLLWLSKRFFLYPLLNYLSTFLTFLRTLENFGGSLKL
jgi:hypothetical protein